jgi:hypothetical protein
MARVLVTQNVQPDESLGSKRTWSDTPGSRRLVTDILFVAVLLVSLSTLTASISNLCIKRLSKMSQPLHPLQMIRFRMVRPPFNVVM